MQEQRAKRSPSRPPIDLALWYLGRRERTKQEIKDKLSRKGYEADDIEGVVKKLQSMGFLDDLRYSQNYISQCIIGKAKGKRRVAFELGRKGVNQEEIDRALEQYWPGEEAEDEIIEKEAIKCLKKNRLLSRDKVFKRSVSYLIRRGFSYEKSKKAVLDNMDEGSFI